MKTQQKPTLPNKLLSNAARTFFGYKVSAQSSSKSIDKTDKIRCDLAEGIWCSHSEKSYALLPDHSAQALVRETAKFLDVSDSYISPAAGSDELIEMIPRIFLDPDDTALVITPTFERLISANIKCGVIPVTYELPEEKGFIFDEDVLEEVIKYIEELQPKLVWLASPNNPTGLKVTNTFIAKLCEHTTNGVVVVDEAYQEYISLDPKRSTVSLVDSYQNLIVLRTFSKAHNAGGYRIGYGVSSQKIAGYLRSFRTMFQLSTPALEKVAKLFSEENILQLRQTVELMNKQKEQLFSVLETLPEIEWTRSDTSILLMKHKSKSLFDELYIRGIVTRNCNNDAGLQGKGYVRVSVQKPNDTQKMIQALKDICSETL